jgi:predicted nucleotidyltransferase
MLIVPSIDDRKKIPKPVIYELVTRIADRFKPNKIILCGSYAYGTPNPESDVDILVVMETTQKESLQSLKIRQFINPMFAVDIIVITPERLKQRLIWGDSFLKEVVNKGILVYESANN